MKKKYWKSHQMLNQHSTIERFCSQTKDETLKTRERERNARNKNLVIEKWHVLFDKWHFCSINTNNMIETKCGSYFTMWTTFVSFQSALLCVFWQMNEFMLWMTNCQCSNKKVNVRDGDLKLSFAVDLIRCLIRCTEKSWEKKIRGKKRQSTRFCNQYYRKVFSLQNKSEKSFFFLFS